MSLTLTSLDTSRVEAAERTGYWANALSALCGDLHADALGNKTIDGHIDHGSIGRLRLCRIEASRHRVALPASWTSFAPHDVVKILFQTQGTSLFEQEGNQITVGPGDCLAYDVSRPHTITSPSLTRHDVVIIPKKLLQQRGVPLDRLHAKWTSARTGVARVAHEFMVSTMKEIGTLSPDNETGVGEALLDMLLLPFCAAASPAGDSSAPAALKNRMKSYICEHLSDPNLNIDRIAASLKCSKRYLHMLFKDEGISISDYIWQARLEKCRRDLETAKVTGKSVTDIAFSWGFSSSSHFCRLFKQKYGVPASAMQRP